MGSADYSPSAQRRAGPDAGATAPVTLPRGAYLGISLIALLLGAAAIVRSTSGVVTIEDSDLTNFFFKAADQILHGHPWAIYAVRGSGYTLTYPNYNPPVSIFLMAPLLALARTLHFAGTYGQQITFVSIPFVAFVFLLGYAAIVALRRLFPSIPETQRFLAYILIVFSPLTWQTFTIWYHIEQPLMLALLVGAVVALQARREGLAGLLAGLAVLTRTTALIPLIALGALLLFGRERRGLLRFGGVAVFVALVGFAPFFVIDRVNATYSLLSWRGTSDIGGNSIWALVKYDGAQAASPLRYMVDHVARRLDMYTAILFVVVVALLAVRRLGLSAYSREAWAVLAIATLAVPMLSKNIWPYYYLEPFVFLLIWEFASMHDRRAGVWRWPILTFGFLSVSATLSQFIGLRSVGAGDRIVVGVLEFCAMLAFALAVWYRARAGRVEPALAMATPPQARAAPTRRFTFGRRQPAQRPVWPSASGPAPDAAGMPGAPSPGWQSGPVRPPEGWRPPSSVPLGPSRPAPAWPPPPQSSQISGSWTPPGQPAPAPPAPGWDTPPSLRPAPPEERPPSGPAGGGADWLNSPPPMPPRGTTRDN